MRLDEWPGWEPWAIFDELTWTDIPIGPGTYMIAARRAISRAVGVDQEGTRNPMYLWKLIRACTAYGLPLPPVALEYLGDVAGNLLKCADSRERKAKENVQGAVFAALFGDPGKGGRSFLTRFATEERDIKIGVSMSADMLERVVPIYGENGEMPILKTVPGASLKEAIANARPLAPELTNDRSFSRALDPNCLLQQAETHSPQFISQFPFPDFLRVGSEFVPRVQAGVIPPLEGRDISGLFTRLSPDV